MENSADKSNLFYFHKTAEGEMENSADKSNFLYFHKTAEGEMENSVDKFNFLYFHKSAKDEMENSAEKSNLFYFHKSAEDEMENSENNIEHPSHHHDERAEIGLFTLDELCGFSVGKKVAILFPIKNHALYPPFLPKEVAEMMPFSSSQVSSILKFFSISPNSQKGKAVQDTLKKCELEAVEGETKTCATSSESLHDFLSNAFGPEVNFKSISTMHPTITTLINQNYTVLESPKEIESQKKVACHPMPYLYAVHFCHFDATETKAFKLQLVGDISGDKVDALVVCHMDISGWSSDHAAFRMYGIKQGDPICHVFSQGNVVWINQPSPVVVSAM